MKIEHDKFTSDMFGNKVGRPPKLHPKSAAARTRDWRARTQSKALSEVISDTIKQVNFDPVISVTRDENSCSWCGCEVTACCGICSIGQLGHIA